MILVLKILHFVAFSIGIGGGMANGLIGGRMARTPDAARTHLVALSKAISRASFGALVVLWITGVWLVLALYGGFGGLDVAFWLKLLMVAALTVAAVAMQTASIRAARHGLPPPPTTMARLGAVASVTSLLALVFAVLAFG